MSKKLISVIIPAYNEEDNVERAYEEVTAELMKLDAFEHEIIFTDNHSTDRTFAKLKAIAARDPRVRLVRFARNFGFQRSILTGYRCARGDAAIQIDCDLEDPPTLFADFLRLWQEGNDVVVGVRAQRAEGMHMVLARRAFYVLLDKISDVRHEIDAGDFRLVDRAILDQLRAIDDAQPYVRGLISELARSQASVRYTRGKRLHGESKFPLRQLLKLALEGIFAYSTAPLRVATYCGLFVALLTAAATAIYIVARLLFGRQWPAGFATTTALILFGISLNALFLGIIGEYIGRIYNQVRKRPTTVVEQAINLDPAMLPSLHAVRHDE